jgi:hypothetical protein
MTSTESEGAPSPSGDTGQGSNPPEGAQVSRAGDAEEPRRKIPATTADRLSQFKVLVGAHVLGEHKRAFTMVTVTSCNKCATFSEHRHRDDGRRATVAARVAAVEHVEHAHKVTFRAHCGGDV